MKDYQLGFHVTRLLNNYNRVTLDKSYVVYSPSIEVRYMAELIYVQSYEQAFYRNLMTQADLMMWMLETDKWSQAEEDRLHGLKLDLEELKCKLFELEMNEADKKLVRGKIKECKDLIEGALKKRHSYDNITCENVAGLARNRFIIGASIKDYWVNPIEDWHKEDNLIDHIMIKLSELLLDEPDIRYVARSDMWRALYKEIESPSDEQLNLMSWTKLYNEIHKHPECPSQETIEDDDLFDGWLIKQRRQTEKSVFERKADKLAQKYGKAGEIFVATDAENAHKVGQMNSWEAQQTKQQRLKALERAGSLSEWEMPDTRAEIEMAMNRGRNA